MAMVKNTLRRVQEGAFTSLVHGEASQQYEADAAAYDDEKSKLEADLRAVQGLRAEELAKLAEESREDQLILELLPELKDQLAQLPHPSTLDVDIADLEQQLAELDNRYAKLFAAWAIPRLIDPSGQVKSEPELVFTDTFPTDEERRCNVTGVVGDRRPSEYRLNSASRVTAEILGEDPGLIWTAKELGEFIYPEDVDNSDSRIAAVMTYCFNYKEGKEFWEYLKEKGLVAQRGTRQYFKDGKPFGRTIYVYRAIRQSEASEVEVTEISSDGTYSDNWPSISSEDTGLEDGSEEYPVDVEPSSIQEEPTDLPTGTEVRPETDAEKNARLLEEKCEKLLRDAAGHFERLIVEAGLTPDSVDISLNNPRISQAIGSASFGTRTNQTKALKAHIISEREVRYRQVNTVAQVIAMAILNSNQKEFSAHKRITANILQLIEREFRKFYVEYQVKN